MATAEAQAQEDARPCSCSYHTCICRCCPGCVTRQRQRAGQLPQQQQVSPSGGGCVLALVIVALVVLIVIAH